jgi:hypothetical protein
MKPHLRPSTLVMISRSTENLPDDGAPPQGQPVLVLKKMRGGWHTAHLRQNLRKVAKHPDANRSQYKGQQSRSTASAMAPVHRICGPLLLWNRPEVNHRHFARAY